MKEHENMTSCHIVALLKLFISNMSYFFAWPKQAGKPSPFEPALFVNGRRSLISKPEVGFLGVVGKEAL